MIEFIKVIILGIVQGITEFLPISSTGHLIIASSLLNFAYSSGGTFEIFIQLGSVLAVVAYYRADLLRQVRTVHRDRGVQKLWVAIVIAAIPAAVAGFLVRDFIKDSLYGADGNANANGLAIIAIALIVGGIIFVVMERLRGRRASAVDVTAEADGTAARADLESITFGQAIVVGIAQMFALVPGVSRSGASIVGGLLGGMNRPTATAFSFYLSIPVLGGATILDLLLSLDEITSGESVLSLIIGTIVTAIVSWFAIDWLLRYVARNDFTIFGVYRIIVGGAILLLAAAGLLM
jgi:undecaprenyl-diphosphatase